jgi:hypothetical protein
VEGKTLITVAILINGQPIMARSAVNKGHAANGFDTYRLDCGRTILHKPSDGAVQLAIAMLRTIKESKESKP